MKKHLTILIGIISFTACTNENLYKPRYEIKSMPLGKIKTLSFKESDQVGIERIDNPIPYNHKTPATQPMKMKKVTETLVFINKDQAPEGLEYTSR